MNITRHNYEEFFILYLDNELSRDDRGRVELFIEQNPDLREELEMLRQATLSVDTSIVYKGKQSLMRSAASCDISLNNYGEWLLLYIDNELTTEQEIAVENFAIAHPAVKKELDILQKTKLQPEENIIFFHKDSLYREEETTRRIPVVRWWRIAAAAALLFAVSITSFFFFTRKSAVDQPPVARATTQAPVAKEPVIVKETIQTPQTVDNKNTAVITNEKKQRISTQPVKNEVAVKKPAMKLKEEIKKEEVLIAGNEKNKNNLPEPTYNPNIKGALANNSPTLTKLNDINSSSPVTNDVSSSFIQTSLRPDNDNADETSASSAKKTKFRGLLRKITRTIEKTTNIKATDDDDRLLVGGLAIRL